MAKTIIDQKQIKKITKNLKKRFSQFQKDEEELEKAGKIILREIRANARQGVGYDGKPLPSITTGKGSWDERRKALAKVNKTSKFYEPASVTSTVSFTGDTIKKLKFKIKGNIIEIFGEGKHKKIRGVRGKFLKKSNSPIAKIIKGLRELNPSYKIIGASDKAKEQIRTNFIRFIRRKLR